MTLRPIEPAPSTDDVERKLTAARTRLILDKPFLGALVLRLPLKAGGDWCHTIATDARSIYYNHEYINQLTLSQIQFVLSHEALHCGLSHFARREHRDHKRWDAACDYAVNQLLIEDNLERPVGALLDDKYKGLTAEEIYPFMDTEEAMDQHLYDDRPNTNSPDNQNNNLGAIQNKPQPANTENPSQTSNNQPPPLSNRERDQLDTQWQQRLAGAAQQASQAGKLSQSLSRMLARLLQPTVPWRSLLARYMSSTAPADYNLTRPSQRREGTAILPSLHTRQIDILIAIDTSGSISQDELDAFLAELNAIKGAMNARITLLACDDKLDPNAPWVFEPWQALNLPARMTGGGGTDFRPVFSWAAAQIKHPDLLVYFTDAVGRFPASKPATPILWLVKGGATVPWGQRIQLN